MVYSAFADLVVLLHFTFVIFVVFGAVLAFKWRWIIWLHLPALVWGAYIEYTGQICPLTPLENLLRSKGDQNTYSGGFVEHYIYPVLYPDELTRNIQLLLGLTLLLINSIIYWRLFLRRVP